GRGPARGLVELGRFLGASRPQALRDPPQPLRGDRPAVRGDHAHGRPIRLVPGRRLDVREDVRAPGVSGADLRRDRADARGRDRRDPAPDLGRCRALPAGVPEHGDAAPLRRRGAAGGLAQNAEATAESAPPTPLANAVMAPTTASVITPRMTAYSATSCPSSRRNIRRKVMDSAWARTARASTPDRGMCEDPR